MLLKTSSKVVRAFADETSQQGVKKIVNGDTGTFILNNNGSVYAFGENRYGHLGTGDIDNKTVPTLLPINNVKDISANNRFSNTFFVKNDGSVYVVGYNKYPFGAALGTGDSETKNTPVKLDIDNVSKVVSNGSSTFFIKNDGSVYACGSNSKGQLGINNTIDKLVPTKVNIDNVKNIILDDPDVGFTFFIKNDGTVYGCGNNSNGQLGLGDTTARLVPTALNITGVKDIIANERDESPYAVFVKEDGTALFSGYSKWNMFGLKDGYYTVPTSIGMSDISKIVVVNLGPGEQIKTFLILKNDGTLWGCGDNGAGVLGLGDTTRRDAPEQINISNNIKDIVSGGYTTFAIMKDGSVYGWGLNSTLGIGVSSGYKCVPTKINIDNVSNVTHCYLGTVFFKNDGSLWVTGNNYSYNVYGYLGLGTSTKEVLVPVPLTGAFSDQTGPTINVTGTPESWINGDVTLTVTAEDSGGIDKITLPDNSTITTSTGTFKVTQNGIYTFKAYDKAGNVTTQTVTVNKIDKTAPGTPSISNNSGTVTITPGTDSDSGVKETNYSIDGGAYQKYTSPFTLNSGNHTVKSKSVDNAGNTSTEVSRDISVVDIALEEATDAVEHAEDTKTQEDVDHARDLVDELPDSSEKQDLENRLDDVQDIIDAKNAAEHAGDTLNQDDLDHAKDLVNNLPDGPEKEELQNKIDDIQDQIDNKKQQEQNLQDAKDAVDHAGDTLNQDDLDHAKDLVNNLPDGPEKEKLQNKIDDIQDQIDNKKQQEQNLSAAIAAVEKAEQTKIKGDYDTALNKVNALTDSSDKTSLLDRLTNVKSYVDGLMTDAESKVSQAESSKTDSDINTAQEAIDMVPDGWDVSNLQNRLDNIKHEVENQTLSNAKAAVEKAEQTQKQEDVDSARTLVNKLPYGNDRTDLNKRLDAVQNIINLFKDAENKVQTAERVKTTSSVSSARTAVNKLPEGDKKDGLNNRLDAVESDIALQNTISILDRDIKSLDSDLTYSMRYTTQVDIQSYQNKIDSLRDRVSSLPDSISDTKTDFNQRLDNIQSKLQQKKESQDALTKVVEALDKAGNTLSDEDIQAAEDAINSLPSNVDKSTYNITLRNIKQKADASRRNAQLQASTAVTKASNTKNPADIQAARVLVEKLPESSFKNQLTDILDRLEQSLQEKPVSLFDQIKDAENLVTNAQISKDSADIDKAQEAVDALPSCSNKTTLQNKLSRLEQQINTEKLQKATSAVTWAEYYCTKDYYDTADTLVQALPDASQTSLRGRLNTIKPAVDASEAVDKALATRDSADIQHAKDMVNQLLENRIKKLLLSKLNNL